MPTTESRRRNSLDKQLGLRVAAGLALFALVAAIATAAVAYRYQMQVSRALQEQLVAVIIVQAEVAAYAENINIANGVIEGLLANPLILAVRIRSIQGFEVVGGKNAALADIDAMTSYPLHSPSTVDSIIGHIDVVMNADQVTLGALRSTLVLLSTITLQVLLAAGLIVWVSRHVIIHPIVDLATRLSEIRPGSGIRITIAKKHEDDEIGQLARSANALIDANESALAELRELATTDSLTGTFNRREFIRRIEDELVRIQRLESAKASVLVLDIDHFKQVNDTFGHAAGDRALMQLGTILRSNARRIDAVGRLGGEEFAILLVSTDTSAGEIYAERLRTTVAETPVAFEGRLIRMTVSIGISTLAPTDSDSTLALARADQALYVAKDQGRNRVVTVQR